MSSNDDVNKEDECVPSSSEDSQDGVSSMENGEEPEFSQKHYDIEPCYYSMTGKSDRNCRGKVYRYREDGDLKGFESHDGTMYRLRDSVFVEMTPNEPYVIAAVCGFKYTKREHVVVKLTRYYRPDDIPDISLNLMKQERAELEINPHLCPTSLNRELFNSEIQITQPVSCLRGKCTVEYVKDVRQARTVADFSLDNDTFFFCLHYNQDSTKLASTHYAIRVGSSFQAKLPPVARCHVGDEKDRDELLYRPDCIDADTEKDYIKLARAFRVYTLSGNHMLDSQKNARVSDLLMDEAIIQLHRSGYKVDDALSELNANDIILTTDVDYMTTDDAKKFTKGIKQLGKNFSRIHRELLPHHSREQLVSYYYLWKKTPEATKPKQAARRINPTTIKRPTKEKVKVSRPTSTEYLDFDSASESDVENNGPSGRACHHCYGAESKDWHHANGLLLCTDCRVHYKKYGQLRSVANRPAQVPACLFKRSNSSEEESGVRTRAGKKEQRRRTPSSMSETPDRRSPSGTNGSAPHLTAEETPTKRLNGAAKRTAKRPLHNGLLNNAEKADSVEPSSPAGSPPKLTNGVTNGHAPGPSTPNGETVSKKMKTEQIDEDDDDEEPGKMTIDEGDDEPMPVLNGFKKEEPVVEEVKMELNGAEEPTTSNGVAEAVVQMNDEVEVPVEDDEAPTEDDPNDTFTLGTSVLFETKNALFIESMKRSCGQRSARTDLHFKLKEGSQWDKNMKEKAERKKNAHQKQEESKMFSQQAQMKKEQAQHQMAAQHQQQQLQQLQHLMMGGMPPEMLRGFLPAQQQFMDPAMMLQQMIQGSQQPVVAAALHHQLAIQQMAQAAQVEHAQQQQQLMRMQEMQVKAIEAQRQQQQQQQREREQAREREQRLQQQQQQEAIRQQQQQQAAAAASLHQINPQLLHMLTQITNSGGQVAPDMMVIEMARQLQAQQAAQVAAQQQREVQERERRERELREQRARELREREEREREERERREREQVAQQQQALVQQAAAAAAAQQQNMPMDPMQQQMMMLIMNPQIMHHFQQQQMQAQAQQQQPPQGANPLHMLQQLTPDMMRRLAQAQMGPQHQ